MKNKITLFLMTYKGFRTLETIIEKGFSDLIDFVVIGKDKNTVNDYSFEIQNLCLKYKIRHFSKSQDYEVISTYVLTVSWRWMIRNLNSQVIVLHESPLPKYRGFAPLVNQLINKESEVGVTALFGTEEYDRGPIIGQALMSIEYPIKIETVIHKISELYGVLVEQIFQHLRIKGEIVAEREQVEGDATYSLWRDEEDYKIDWYKDSRYIKRFVDSVGFPYLGASSIINGTQVRISDVELVDDVVIENRIPGKVIFLKNKKPVIVCGKGLIRILKANYSNSNESLLPLKSFRLRFK